MLSITIIFMTTIAKSMVEQAHRSTQKLRTRERILDAAGRGFRKGGFGGVGVDGLAKEAGVTSGAFYVHFDSKAAAFRDSVAHGLASINSNMLRIQAELGSGWWPAYVRFYLSAKRTCDLAESCPLQSMTPEVARSDASSRVAFEAGFRQIINTIITGPKSPKAPRDAASASSALGALIGTVTLARAVDNPQFAEQLAAATERTLLGKK
jgi:TetR/AcrR family transcriptional regulator, transcriptional repressor for nem operon